MISLGEIYFSESEHRKLLDLVDSICMIFPPNRAANALSRFGIGYFNRKEFDQALDIYKIIITHYDRNLNAYADAGATYIMSGRPEEAVPILQQALKINPTDSLTLEYLCQANIFMLRNDIAAYYKTTIYDSDTANINIILDMAFVTFPFDKEASIAYFEKYISSTQGREDQKQILQLAKEITADLKQGKDDNLVNLMRSEKLNGAGYVNYALSLLSRVIEKDNSNSPAYFDLAMIYRDLNMPAYSLKYLSLCEELTQDLGKARDILTIVYHEKAKTYFLMKDYMNVIKYVKLNIEKFDKNTSELRYLLGLAYLNNGDTAAAKEEFNTSIRLGDDKKIIEQAKFELESLK